MAGQLLSGVPVLISNDFDRTMAFYKQFRFTEIARYDQEGYLILRREGLELHFIPKEDNTPETNWHSAYVRILNVTGLAQEFTALNLPTEGCPRYNPPTLRPWGMIEGYIIDPDGNLLKLGAAHEDAAAGS